MKKSCRLSRQLAASPNRRFKFDKRSQLFIPSHNETPPVVTMCVSNPDRSPAGIHGCDTAPAPTAHGRSWEALRTSLAVSRGRCAKAMRATSSALCRLCSAICRFRLSCSAPVWPICNPKKAPTRVPVTLSARETNIEQSGYRIRLNSSGGQTCPDYCGY